MEERPQDSIITEEMHRAIGAELEPVVLEVEKSHIRRFAQAIDDPNPLWQDEEYARKTRYGGIIAPPTFLCVVRSEAIPKLPFQHSFPRRLNGANRWELFLPVRPGDTITARPRISDIYERPSRLGTMLGLVTETTYANQRGEVVARHWGTTFLY